MKSVNPIACGDAYSPPLKIKSLHFIPIPPGWRNGRTHMDGTFLRRIDWRFGAANREPRHRAALKLAVRSQSKNGNLTILTRNRAVKIIAERVLRHAHFATHGCAEGDACLD